MKQYSKTNNTVFVSVRLRIFIACSGFLMLFVVCSAGIAGDWVTYRSKISRSGMTSETIGPRLFLQWKYSPIHPPKPAWPMPSEEMPRMHNDNAYHSVIANNNVYFGSCITNKVYSIDANKGKMRWEFFTQGPVRFAPTFYNGRIYVGSDDGYVYCLDSKDGSLAWKYRAGPSDEKVIGNGRMISLWPVRTGVIVDNGIVYFAAGVFPYEGLYICALQAEDGSVVWKNDTIGDLGHELDYGGISPHGYLVASQDVLFVPSGRSMPAAFDRQTGKFLFCASPGAKRGGTWALIDNDNLISGVDYSGTPHKVTYDAKTGRRQGEAFAWFPGIDMVLTREVSYVLAKDRIYAINRSKYMAAAIRANKLANENKQLASQLSSLRSKLESVDEKANKKIKRQIDELSSNIASLNEEEKRLKDTSYEWSYSKRGLHSLILAGDFLFAGGEGFIVGVDSKTGKEVWESDVDGVAVGLAASNGHLVVSSDKGPIYCFGETDIASAKNIESKIKSDPYPNDSLTEKYKEAARNILAESGIRKGYALVMDCSEGRLAYELAKRTELKIVGLEKDTGKLAVARKNLEIAGLLGKKVVVEPWDMESLPNYFANLIVSDSMLTTGRTEGTREEVRRILRPWGGTACLSFRREGEVVWRKFIRGPLERTGAWTQQFSDPQNTACSGDDLVYGPLGILWFGGPGPQGMVERHACAQSPVSMNGRLFMQGEELIMAVDSFNGTLLWKREIPGAVRVKVKADSGNLVVTENGLFVAAHDKCYRLNPETGETMREYHLPPSSDSSPRRWGYISVVNNILYGSTATAMDEDYGAILKRFIENGKWKNMEDIPDEFKERYEYSKKLYPDIRSLMMAAQRSGAMYRSMTSFARGGEFLQKNAVTENLMVSDKIFAMNT